MSLRDWLDKLFPSEDGRRSTNELVERGLEALRAARDDRAFTMGDVTRVPSRLELRISTERFDELKAMDAARDLEFFFNDELMKDLSAEGMRTFGDHAVHIGVAADTTLQPEEIYAVVLAPESGPAEHGGGGHARSASRSQDSTRMMGEEEPGPSTVAVGAAPSYSPTMWRMSITAPGGFSFEERLEGMHWIIGRRGTSGKPLPDRFRKVDVDFRETVSREQVKVELLGDRMSIERLGKAAVYVSKREQLEPGESRTIPLGVPFYIDEYEVMITH